jgi:hypothetical protein
MQFSPASYYATPFQVLSTLFSIISGLFSSLKVINQVSHTLKANLEVFWSLCLYTADEKTKGSGQNGSKHKEKSLDWIYLVQVVHLWRTFVNTETNLQILQSARRFLTVSLLASQEGPCFW